MVKNKTKTQEESLQKARKNNSKHTLNKAITKEFAPAIQQVKKKQAAKTKVTQKKDTS